MIFYTWKFWWVEFIHFNFIQLVEKNNIKCQELLINYLKIHKIRPKTRKNQEIQNKKLVKVLYIDSYTIETYFKLENYGLWIIIY